MKEEYAIIGEKLSAFAEEGVIESDADVLEHADRDNALKATSKIAVILQTELSAIGEAIFGCSPA